MNRTELLTLWPTWTAERRDAEVAERVMGWGKWEWCPQGHHDFAGAGWNWTIAGSKAPHYNEFLPVQSIRSAWSVVQEMLSRGFRLELFSPQEEFSTSWRCVFYSLSQDAVHADSATAQECISLAALMAVTEDA